MHTALKSTFAIAATVVSIAASAQSLARFDTPQIDARQVRQEQRIQQGLARGELTRQEARTLQQGQREIARAERRAKADGRVTREEFRHLTALLDRADVQIRQLRRDRDGRRPT